MIHHIFYPHVCTCTCMYTCMCTCTCIQLYIRIDWLSSPSDTGAHVHVYACMCLVICTHCIYMYMYIMRIDTGLKSLELVIRYACTCSTILGPPMYNYTCTYIYFCGENPGDICTVHCNESRTVQWLHCESSPGTIEYSTALYLYSAPYFVVQGTHDAVIVLYYR